MELSILVAKMIALLYLSAGIAALSGKVTFSKSVGDFEKSSALTFITGFMALILGMLLVQYHNFWVKDWTVLIAIVGWISLLKGIMLIAIPQSISWFKGWFKNPQMYGVFMIVFALVFGYFGFVM